MAEKAEPSLTVGLVPVMRVAPDPVSGEDGHRRGFTHGQIDYFPRCAIAQ
jgi:hypothetical protein